jgi:hypothetical protein
VFTVPKGYRSMTRIAADAVDVASMPGVDKVVHDPKGDVTYVKCSRKAWTEIQFMVSKRVGVQHTGAVGNAARASIWEVNFCRECGGTVSSPLKSKHGGRCTNGIHLGRPAIHD